MTKLFLFCCLAVFTTTALAQANISLPKRSWVFQAKATRSLDGSRVASYNCVEERTFSQRLDHFTRKKEIDDARFTQRYIVCDKFWDSSNAGPIFFYVGNEADVWLYVNNTGLMWENAEEFGALVVFAEHRYYGSSQPFGPDSWEVDPSYLTSAQAMADYAALLWHIKTHTHGAYNSPVIAFGGSYGGMLAAWMRMKYPHLVHGAIAASAPIGAFPGVPDFRPQAYWEVVTRAASADAGSAAACVNNTRTSFAYILAMVNVSEARIAAQHFIKLCKPLKTAEDVFDMAYWVQGAFDAFAMGNYPYPSSYINGDPLHPLPAWPMKAACKHMTEVVKMYPSDLMQAVGKAVGILYNASGTLPCFDIQQEGPAAGSTGPWDFQFCTELMAQEQPYFPATGVADMFWEQGPFNWTSITQHCKETWGVTPEAHYAVQQYGGLDLAASTTNIVFSNGLLDPWSVFGVLDNVSDTVVSVVIPDGAHHVDLMFSHPRDTPSIKEARKVELEHIRRWILEHATSLGPRPKASLDSNWGAGEARSEGRVQVAVAGAAARTGGTREGNVGAMLRGGKAVTASA